MARTGPLVEFLYDGGEGMKYIRGTLQVNIDRQFAKDWGINPKTQSVVWFTDENGKEWRTIVKIKCLHVIDYKF